MVLIMPYFLFDGVIDTGQTLKVEGEEAAHIREARRIRVGEQVQLQDVNQERYACEVVELHKKYVICKPLKKIEVPAESSLEIHVFISMVKEKAMDTILQKCTELGVAAVHIVESDYSKQLPESKQRKNKQERWQRIMLEACKQSERISPPELIFEGSLEEAYRKAEGQEMQTFILHPGKQNLALAGMNLKSVALFIGPEGGYSEEELEELDLKPFSLGKRILRADTAVIASVSIFQHLLGDLN